MTGPTPYPGELRTLAETLARAAGSGALDGRRALGIGRQIAHDTKSTETDPVTEFDRVAEALLVEELQRLRPDDAIVGEEGTSRPGTSGLEWHLDPIDGTVNFVYDLPTWSTSVAVVDDDGSLAAAVYVPVTDELYSAARGAGATMNGTPIEVSGRNDLATALVATGFNYDPEVRRRQAERLARLLGRVRDVRRYGSAALDLCLAASGRVDAYFEERLNSWDMAAGVLIATEAGATASDFAGGEVRPDEVVVAAPGVHEALLDALRDASS